tara:strand:+ start:1694 stop:2236 length:543 start_codon:yes stop_codon:yes gene_type:complete
MRNTPFKQEVAQQLFNNIPNNVINKWGLTKPDTGFGIFRFKKQKISAIYYRVFSKTYGDVIIKYPSPHFKFEYIYILHKDETDGNGRKIERRYDGGGNIESEYVKSLNKEDFYTKIKSKGKEVHLPYIWGKDPYPLENVSKISSYLTKVPTQFKWFHKKNNLEDKYIIAYTNGIRFKNPQ